MAVVITKMHRTNRVWFEDLEPAHYLHYVPYNLAQLVTCFSKCEMPEAARRIVANDTPYAVSKVRVSFVPVAVALGMSAEALNAIAPNFAECFSLLKDQGVEALIIGFKES